MASATVENSALPRQFGKTALMLHGLGVLFLLAGAGTLAAVGAEKNESYTFLGFGGAAFGVLTLWALWLLVRSYRARERSGFAFGLILILLFEYTATSALLKAFNYEKWSCWFVFTSASEVVNGSFDFCLPAITAFLFIVLAAGAPLARWLVRRVDEAQRPARRRQWLKRIFIVAIPIVFVPLLFLYALLTIPLPNRNYRNGRFSVWIARQAPHVLSDGLEQAADSSSRLYWKEIQFGLLRQGCASKERMVTRLSRLGSVESDAAWFGLENYYHDALLNEAIRLGKVSGGFAGNPFRFIGYWIAKNATSQQIREILDAGKEYRVEFRRYLLAALVERNGTADYTLDMLRLAAEEVTCRRIVAGLDDPQKFEKAWTTLFAQKNWPDRGGLAYAIPYFEEPLDYQLRLFQPCLKDPDVNMRRAAMASACLMRHTFNWSAASSGERKAWLESMLNYVDDSDLFMRRSAVHILATFTDVPISVTPDESALIEKPEWKAAGPVSGEEQEREAVRAAARKWLAEK